MFKRAYLNNFFTLLHVKCIFGPIILTDWPFPELGSRGLPPVGAPEQTGEENAAGGAAAGRGGDGPTTPLLPAGWNITVPLHQECPHSQPLHGEIKPSHFCEYTHLHTHQKTNHFMLCLLLSPLHRVTRSRCCSTVKTASTWPAVTPRRSTATLTHTRTHTYTCATAAHCTTPRTPTPLSLRDSALYWDTSTGTWSR